MNDLEHCVCGHTMGFHVGNGLGCTISDCECRLFVLPPLPNDVIMNTAEAIADVMGSEPGRARHVTVAPPSSRTGGGTRPI